MHFDRATEELILLVEDTRAAAAHHTTMYDKLTEFAASNMCAGMRALLLKKCVSLASSMTNIWNAAEKLGVNVGTMPDFILGDSDHVIHNNTDDAEEFEAFFSEEESENEDEDQEEQEQEEEDVL
jgi:exonuclease I